MQTDIELSDKERNTRQGTVNDGRSSGGKILPKVKPQYSAGRITPPEADHEISLEDHERTKCEVWTRVMGYHRPVSAFNHGKKAEHAERVCFTEVS